MEALLDIESVSYTYGGASTPALHGVSLRLDAGLHVVAGPSGGGKSTLLRLCNGIVPHMYGGRFSGRVRAGGADVLRNRPRHLAATVGFVVQDVERQAVHSTVERDIAFALENRAVPPPEMRRRVHEVAERLEISALLGRAIATLSGGERQRVAVAGALVLEPSLLVLDEPLSQLDRAGSVALLSLLSQLREQGTSVLVSEHRLDELLPAADSLTVVEEGGVLTSDAPARLAGRLDTAPQVVRLCGRLGVDPPLLHPAALPWPPPQPIPAPARRASPAPVWSLDRVCGGPGGCVRDVSLGGAAGEVVALMGENGSGKTTLLRLIAGLLRPRAGVVERAPGPVAYLPQNPAVLLHRESIAAEIAWTERAGPGRGAGRAIAEALGLRHLDADPRDLSSGQRQRAAIAAVLAGHPSLLLLDEPTRGMDGRSREALVGVVRQAAAGGAAVVVATHDAELAALLADRVCFVTAGGVRDAGPPAAALGVGSPHPTQLGRFGAVTVEDAMARLAAAPMWHRPLTMPS
ncbi:MAG: ABC transporter ATP-binding protein [Candidatus Dormibacteria bacterium]